MSFRTRLIVFVLVLLLAAALDALFAPFLVAHGVRLWLERAAEQEGLRAGMETVEAPFLRPVTIRNLRMTADRAVPREVSLEAATVIVDLNFRGWIFGRRAPFLHSISIDHFKGNIRAAPKAGGSEKAGLATTGATAPGRFSHCAWRS